MGKVITVWGSPGSGKSMFCCILAKALTRADHRIERRLWALYVIFAAIRNPSQDACRIIGQSEPLQRMNRGILFL